MLLGAKGQLGLQLQATCPAHIRLIATGRDSLDITNAEHILAALATHQPDAVINATAYTAVDKAETYVENAYAINHLAVKTLAQAVVDWNLSQPHSAYLLHVSTDFVFDGQQSTPYAPTDFAHPQGVYGASKLAGEQAIQTCCPTAGIVRTSWLYSVYGNNFVKTMLRLMAERDALGVVVEQVGSPTWARTLADTLWAFVALRPAGIFHCSDNGVASWYDFAKAIQEEALALGLINKVIPITPLRSAQYPTPASRPAYSVLDKRSTEQLLGYLLPYWRDSLRAMLGEFKQ
jgi:dTDP-4-dehydrorhamnose reductase